MASIPSSLARRAATRGMTLIEVLIASVIMSSAVIVLVTGMGHVTGQVVLAAIVTGLLCSALAFTLQLWGQRYVDPSRAAVILLFEPVVAGFVGFFVGERLGVSGYAGAAVIFGGIVLAESRAWWRGRASLAEPAHAAAEPAGGT